MDGNLKEVDELLTEAIEIVRKQYDPDGQLDHVQSLLEKAQDKLTNTKQFKEDCDGNSIGTQSADGR